MKPKKRLQFYLTDRLTVRLENAVEKTGMSEKAIFEAALSNYLTERGVEA